MKYNEPLFRETINLAKTGNITDKKIAVYSHKTMVLLRYLQLSFPNFVRSPAVNEKLFQAMPDHHPELWDRILSEIPQNKENVSQWKGKNQQLKHPKIGLLKEAFDETKTTESRIITIYSPQLTALFKYLEHTTIRFKTSKHGAEILEDTHSKEYPEIWAKISAMVD